MFPLSECNGTYPRHHVRKKPALTVSLQDDQQAPIPEAVPEAEDTPIQKAIPDTEDTAITEAVPDIEENVPENPLETLGTINCEEEAASTEEISSTLPISDVLHPSTSQQSVYESVLRPFIFSPRQTRKRNKTQDIVFYGDASDLYSNSESDDDYGGSSEDENENSESDEPF